MALYVGNPKDSTKKLVRTNLKIGKFGKVSGLPNQYIKITCISLYQQTLRAIKKTILFTVALKRKENALTREVNGLYTENCKMLMKVIEEDTDK